MAKTKAILPDNTKLDYTMINGAATIQIAASLTTRGQVALVIEQLEKLALVLPEARTRKVKAKPKVVRQASSDAA